MHLLSTELELIRVGIGIAAAAVSPANSVSTVDTKNCKELIWK